MHEEGSTLGGRGAVKLHIWVPLRTHGIVAVDFAVFLVLTSATHWSSYSSLIFLLLKLPEELQQFEGNKWHQAIYHDSSIGRSGSIGPYTLSLFLYVADEYSLCLYPLYVSLRVQKCSR